MHVTRIQLRDFRNYERVDLELGAGLTVVSGSNGAGKTNLLEAVYFGCTTRSPRTSNERELVRRGASVARVVLSTEGEEGGHVLEVGFAPGDEKRVSVDGSTVEPGAWSEARPLVGVFIPERLTLVKGAPSARRGHLDQVVAALWPSRAETRTAYGRALAQRNALLGRIRAGAAGPASLDAWDGELARRGTALMDDRREAAEQLAPRFSAMGADLGLPGIAGLAYRPRSGAREPDALQAELAERRQADIDRGFTAHGPHRDDVSLTLDGQALRSYGSQGQQRAALLSLLFAERDLLAEVRGRPPLMLLDDVMSELDASRRELLADLLRSGGQAIVTATDADQVPGSHEAGTARVEVDAGEARLVTGAPA